MNLRYFFEGMLDHEVSASAFLAMMLDGSVPFRERFLDQVLPSRPETATARWMTEVERDQVDVTLGCESWFVLIENKIQGGSVQDGQLRRYYEHAREKQPPSRRLAAVYVTPKGIGSREVDLVRGVLRDGDVATQVLWEQEIGNCIEAVPEGPERDAAESGFRSVLRIIEERKRGLTWSDERAEMRRIAKWALDQIRNDSPDVPLLTWESANQEQIFTPKAWPCSLFLTLDFPESGPPDHEPLTSPVDGKRAVRLRLQFRQGSLIKASSDLGARWLRRSDEWHVPNVGLSRRTSRRGWYEFSEDCVGTSEEIAERMARIGSATIAATQSLDASGS